MNLCRICRSNSVAEKDINQLLSDADGSPRNGSYIYNFCLNIEIEKDLNTNNKLCQLCFEKVLSFYEFKCLALRNNGYRADGSPVTKIKIEVVFEEEKCEDDELSNKEYQEAVPGPAVKEEVTLHHNRPHGLSGVKHEPIAFVNIKQEKPDIAETNDEEKNEPIVDLPPLHNTKPNRVPPKQSTKPKEKPRLPEECKVCGKTVTKMRVHRLLHLPLEERRRFECEECGKAFLSDSAKVRHHKIKHLGLMEKCPTCDKVVANLRQHELVMHNNSLLRFACTFCDRRFRGQALLDEHMGTHTNERLFQSKCDVCEKSFVNKYVLMKHKQQVHEKVKSHVCEHCQKSFFEKSNLKLHLRTHTKEKPYECNECGKRWGNTNLLKKHLITHTDLRKYPCTMCDKIYKRPDRLRQHMAKHTQQQQASQPAVASPGDDKSIVIEVPIMPSKALESK